MSVAPEPMSTYCYVDDDLRPDLNEDISRNMYVHSRLPSTRALHAFGGTVLARRNRSKTRPTDNPHSPSGSVNDAMEFETTAFQELDASAGPGRSTVVSRYDSELLTGMTLKDLETIKTLPCSMKDKRHIRNHLVAKGEQQMLKENRGRNGKPSSLVKFSDEAVEVLYSLKLWEKSIHEIEGRFGSAVRSYFAFLRWLFFLNFAIFLIIFGFIIVPSIIYTNSNSVDTKPVDETCAYEPYNPDELNSFVQYIIWWFTGQGFMEKTYLFIGYYPNVSDIFSYNIPLAYLCVAGVYFILSLITLISRAARGWKESLTSEEDRFYSYCNKVFAGWDYCINDVDAAKLKHQSLLNEIRADIADEQTRTKKENRTRREWFRLYLKRAFINIFVLIVLGGALFAIYIAATYALETADLYKDNFFMDLLITYLVSIVITAVNFIAPPIYNFLIVYEEYSPDFAMKFTLMRTVLLRLASIVFLYTVVYIQITCDVTDLESCEYCGSVPCWETYLGQEMYKLTILDFFIVVTTTLFVEFPRKLIVSSCGSKLPAWVTLQEFYLPGKVLDIVYSQTICWIGAFYAPLLPGIVVIKFFFFFYLQKISLLYNCQPDKRPFRASRTGTFFFVILLFGFAVAIVPVIVGMTILTPSSKCTPFRNQTSMFETVTGEIKEYPVPVQKIFWFLGSPSFSLILGLLLLIGVYYYRAYNSAHKKLIKVLREQLSLEGKDKQFLLHRVTKLTDALKEKGVQLSHLDLSDDEFELNPSAGTVGPQLRNRTTDRND